MPSDSAVQVFVRVRGLNDRERRLGDDEAWELDAQTLAGPGNKRYTFDHVFGPDSSTADLYAAAVTPLIEHALQGFNGTLFAYGQTGAGKTFTMMGTEAQPGVLPNAVQHVFDHIASTPATMEWVVHVSYLEIYNETIKDLLAPGKHARLQIHDSRAGPVVRDAESVGVSSTEQVLALLARGEEHRHTGRTQMNAASSRSHTIFRLALECVDSQAGANRTSVLHLVDLAGSERQSKTGAQGERLAEGAAINRSLLVLGTVISKLSEGKGKGGFVPFRDSKLTRLLSTSLGGNAHTAIIGAVSPAASNAPETTNTLDFCRRAKRIVNRVARNEVEDSDTVIARYKAEVAALRAQLSGGGGSSSGDAELEQKLEREIEHERELEDKLHSLENLLLKGAESAAQEAEVQPAHALPGGRQRAYSAVAPRRRFSAVAHVTLGSLAQLRAVAEVPESPSEGDEGDGDEGGEGDGDGEPAAEELRRLRERVAELEQLEKNWQTEREILLQAAEDAQRREREALEQLEMAPLPDETCVARWVRNNLL